MVQRFFSRLWTIVVCVGFGVTAAGCQQAMQAMATEPVLAATPTATTSPVLSSIETEVADVKIAMEVPKGWRSQQARYGVLLIEKTGYSHGNKLSGMQVYVFVRVVDDFNVAAGTNSNIAWNILSHIVSVPEYIGDAAVSGPKGFRWKGHDAAYYLLNDSNSNLSLVLAMIMPQSERLVVFNVSCPQERAADILVALPEMLKGLTLNDMAVDPSLVDKLPDPLIFPVYAAAEATDTN